MITWALNLSHDVPSAGHRGVEATQKKLDTFGFLPKSQQHIQRHIKSCMTCIQYKRKYNMKVPDVQMRITTRPWERLNTDLIGPLPRSVDGHIYILTLVDHFTKFLIAVPLRNKSAKVVAKAIFERVIAQYGPMNTIISDQGSEYTSEIWKHLMESWDIYHLTTGAYSAQSNGAAEKCNDSIIQILTTLVADNPKIWSTMLYYATYAYNTAFHSAIKDSPFYLLHLYDPIHPTQYQLFDKQQIDLNNYKETALAMQRAAFTRVKNILDANRQMRESTYKPIKTDLKEGMRCFIYAPPEAGKPRKFQKKYKGPMRLYKILGQNTMLVQRISTGKIYKTSLRNLKIVPEEELTIDQSDTVRKAFISPQDDDLDELVDNYQEIKVHNQQQKLTMPLPGRDMANISSSDDNIINIEQQLSNMPQTKPTRMHLRSDGPVKPT